VRGCRVDRLANVQCCIRVIIYILSAIMPQFIVMLYMSYMYCKYQEFRSAQSEWPEQVRAFLLTGSLIVLVDVCDWKNKMMYRPITDSL
jgi:hypothetical protein